MKALFDTNILIDYLNGFVQAEAELNRYRTRLISRITWMEVLAGVETAHEEETRRFLRIFRIEEITPAIATTAVALRREHRLRLPDAIILATARESGCLLVTRNVKDFHKDWPDIREPYRL